jgi:hypothetical protein
MTPHLSEKITRLTNLNLQIAESELQQLKKSCEWRSQLASECLSLLHEVFTYLKEQAQQPTEVAYDEEPEGLSDEEALEAGVYANNPEEIEILEETLEKTV